MKKLMILIIFFTSNLDATIIGSDLSVARQARAFFKKLTSDTNKMKGFSVFQKGFVLEDPSTVASFDAFFPVSGDVVLNGGTLELQGDIEFKSPFRIGVGRINGNGYTVELPRNVSYLDFPSMYYIKLIVSLIDTIDVNHTVYSIDWNFNNTYIAVALRGKVGNNELKILKFENNILSEVTSEDFGLASLSSVRWHPSQNYLATAASSGSELKIWSFDTDTQTLTETDTKNINTSTAVSWRPTGDYLAVGESKSNQLRVYPFSGGALGTVITGGFGKNVTVQNNALDWNYTGDKIAVGLQQTNNSGSLRLFSFDGSTLSEIDSIDLLGNCNAVSWMPSKDCLAVGGSLTDERLMLFHYQDGALSELTSARVGLDKTVLGLRFDASGIYLGVAKEYAVQGYELDVYYFDQTDKTFHLVSGYSSDAHSRDVAWSPSGDYVISGDDSENVHVFGFTNVPFTFNKLKLFLGSKVITHASIHFEDECMVNGNGNILELSSTTSLVVMPNSTLTLEDIIIKGVEKDNLLCMGVNSKIVFRNATISLDNDVTVTCGSFEFVDDVILRGDHTLIYATALTSTIKSKSRLIFDSNLTFSYCPSNANKSLIEFADNSSQLVLDGAHLHADEMGMQLTKGKLFINRNSQLSSEGTTGFIFGDGTAVNDVLCTLLTGMQLYVSKGYLYYQNALESSWDGSNDAILRIGSNSILQLDTVLNIGVGTVRLDQGSMIKHMGSGGVKGRIFSSGEFDFVNG